LIWLKDANCFGEQDWETAMQSADNLASGQCGLNDGSTTGMWRLPTIEEWEAMVDETYQPALSNTAGIDKWTEGDAFSDVQSDFYWSSSSTNFANSVWIVNGYFGSVNGYYKPDSNDVWPVRDSVKIMGYIPSRPPNIFD